MKLVAIIDGCGQGSTVGLYLEDERGELREAPQSWWRPEWLMNGVSPSALRKAGVKVVYA